VNQVIDSSALTLHLSVAEPFGQSGQLAIIVDDIDLSDVDGWNHYYAWDFVSAVERGDIPIDPPSPME
jgi:phosphatidylethanolamine-binding protein (PEBP) family uncharacterized protein